MTNRKPVLSPNCLLSLPWVIALLAAGGCGSGRPETVLVTGTVTYQGRPVEGANVMFNCASGRPAYGITDAEGRFELGTFSKDDGAIAGEHTVVISKYVTPNGAPVTVAGTGTEPGQDSMRPAPNRQPRQTIPERYTSPSRSPLQVKVTSDGDNDFMFELTNE